MPGIGGVPNDLTLDDARAVLRGVREVDKARADGRRHRDGGLRRAAAAGGARRHARTRRSRCAASASRTGASCRRSTWDRGAPVAVLGQTARAASSSPAADPVGQMVRVGDWRMRVIGVLAPRGQQLGLDMDDVVVVPVATAMKMLNRARPVPPADPGAHPRRPRAREAGASCACSRERHGEEDVTVITQDAVVSAFSSILGALTLALGGIAAVSLAVAGVGIMNVMLVSVSERTREVGLLKALGAGRRQILAVFLAEAILLSVGRRPARPRRWAGSRCALLVAVYPALPATPPLWAVAAAFSLSVAVGAVFGVLPARRATRLDPVAALAGR